VYDIEANYQQAQELPDQSIMQGAGAEMHVRLKSQRSWEALDGLAARWEARSSVTSTQALQSASSETVTNSTPNYFVINLDSTDTGTAYTNWVWSIIVEEDSVDYVLGTGRWDSVASSWTGAGSVITSATTQAAIDASIATHTADASAHHTKYTDAEALAAAVAGGCVTSGVSTATFEAHTGATGTNVHGLGTASTSDVDDFATGAEGNLATTAVQPTETRVLTFNSAHDKTNTYGGLLVQLGKRVQSGHNTTASGVGAHAEGFLTEASGTYSHSEGFNTTASGSHAHAEGNNTTASGSGAHAEGFYSEASGNYSHAGGFNSTAAHESSFVWSGGADVSSTDTNQFTVHALNGIRLMGGTTTVDGLSVTNGTNVTYTSQLASSTTSNVPAIVGVGTGGSDSHGLYGEARGDGQGVRGYGITTPGGYFWSGGETGLVATAGGLVPVGLYSPHYIKTAYGFIGSGAALTDIPVDGFADITGRTNVVPIWTGSVWSNAVLPEIQKVGDDYSQKAWYKAEPSEAIDFPTNSWSAATPYLYSGDGTNFVWIDVDTDDSFQSARTDHSTTTNLTWLPTTYSAKWTPSGSATFAMSTDADYPRATYALWIYAAETITFDAQIDLQNEITPTGTNLWVITPADTSTNWVAIGRAL
jgi:hypothetical protein